MRWRLEIKIEWHCKCNRVHIRDHTHISREYARIYVIFEYLYVIFKYLSYISNLHIRDPYSSNIRDLLPKRRLPLMKVCVWECDTTHSDVWRDSNISRSASEASPPRTSLYILYSIWGGLRLVGSLKVQVSFAKYSLFYRALLQKRPMILRSLLIVATP